MRLKEIIKIIKNMLVRNIRKKDSDIRNEKVVNSIRVEDSLHTLKEESIEKSKDSGIEKENVLLPDIEASSTGIDFIIYERNAILNNRKNIDIDPEIFKDYPLERGGDIVKDSFEEAFLKQSSIRESYIEFIKWAQNQNIQNIEIFDCLSNITEASQFAKQHGYTSEDNLILIKDIYEVECIFSKMQRYVRFNLFSSEIRVCFAKVERVLIDFIKNGEKELIMELEADDIEQNEKNMPEQILMQWKMVQEEIFFDKSKKHVRDKNKNAEISEIDMKTDFLPDEVTDSTTNNTIDKVEKVSEKSMLTESAVDDSDIECKSNNVKIISESNGDINSRVEGTDSCFNCLPNIVLDAITETDKVMEASEKTVKIDFATEETDLVVHTFEVKQKELLNKHKNTSVEVSVDDSDIKSESNIIISESDRDVNLREDTANFSKRMDKEKNIYADSNKVELNKKTLLEVVSVDPDMKKNNGTEDVNATLNNVLEDKTITPFGRKEWRENFEDKRAIKKNKIREEDLRYLHHSVGDSPQVQLRNKIVDQFNDISLLCEIPIDNEEYMVLCKYIQKKYESLAQGFFEANIDFLITVGMIQIGMRTYDNTFWPHVAEAIGVKSIPLLRRTFLGECVMQTLGRLGKVVCEGEYVATILLHGFIVDSYAYRVFNYLFQYYNIDLKRDISDLRDNDLEYLCASIINPYAKRQQLLSNYMGISIRAEKDFTKKVLLSILKLIDQNFWNEYTENISLPGRLDVFFKKWKEQSSFYKEEKEKNDNNRITNKPHNFRTPQLHCDMNNAEFMIILPEQLIRNELIENGECFYWKISHNGNSRTLRCTIREGFSGYSTHEEIINIEPSEQFSAYHFSFIKGEEVVREFVWKARQANFFNHEGIWVNSQRIKQGELFAYSNIECTITSRGILCSRVRNGLMFYEFEFLNGDVISVEAEANYYVGQIPSDGISSEGHVIGAKLVYGDEEYDIYNNAPSIILSAEEEQLNGIALIVNGIVSHFIKNSFIDLQIENSKSKYYVLDTENIAGITEGINKIVIDFPATSKTIMVNFAYIKGLSYKFEDEPYVFQTKGTLSVNLLPKSKFKLIDERGGNEKNFEISQLLDTKVSRKIQNGAEQYDLMFDVPVFEYSTDERNWSIVRPQDVWHNDLPAVYYIRCSVEKIGLCVKSSVGDKKNLYTKNSNGIFVCDITKLKTYLYNERFIEKIYVLIEKKEYDFVRILMKSYFVNAILEADIENEQLIAKFNILGKNVYYADFKCNNEVLLEKEPISDGQIVASIPIVSSTEYTLTVFEQEDEFAFDEEYTYVGSKNVSIFNPNNLIGSRFKLQNIMLAKDGSMYEIASTYYGYIDEKIDVHKYKGLLVEVFHESNITKAAEVIIHISDLNHVNQVVIKFLDEYEEEMEYEYDNYFHRIVEEEQKKISKSQAYRRYEMLDSDKFIWNILYDEAIKDYTTEAREKIQTMKNARKNSLVWKSY